MSVAIIDCGSGNLRSAAKAFEKMATKTITITLTDTQQDILENDLSNIDTWIQGMVDGKENKCWLRLQEEWTNKLMNDESFTDPIPSNKADFITLVMSRGDYVKAKDKSSDM